jgi:hypothetical protein
MVQAFLKGVVMVRTQEPIYINTHSTAQERSSSAGTEIERSLSGVWRAPRLGRPNQQADLYVAGVYVYMKALLQEAGERMLVAKGNVLMRKRITDDGAPSSSQRATKSWALRGHHASIYHGGRRGEEMGRRCGSYMHTTQRHDDER